MFENIIEDYLKRLQDHNVRSIILFGSVARGEAREDSDVDLLVIASGLPDIKKRYDDLLPARKPARIDDIWMTPEELEEMVDAKTGFVMDALMVGEVLLDDGTVEEAKKRLKASLKRLGARRLKHGWFIPRDDLRK
jgi:Nucleotidyltransferase domain.